MPLDTFENLLLKPLRAGQRSVLKHLQADDTHPTLSIISVSLYCIGRLYMERQSSWLKASLDPFLILVTQVDLVG